MEYLSRGRGDHAHQFGGERLLKTRGPRHGREKKQNRKSLGSRQGNAARKSKDDQRQPGAQQANGAENHLRVPHRLPAVFEPESNARQSDGSQDGQATEAPSRQGPDPGASSK